MVAAPMGVIPSPKHLNTEHLNTARSAYTWIIALTTPASGA
jgi:hypothetical protein